LEVERINLRDAGIIYMENFLSAPQADKYFNILLKELDWEQHYIKIFGKTHPQPRLTALYAENDDSYTYSGLTLTPLKFHPVLKELQEKLAEVSETEFTHCLANLYRDGSDSMGLHADDEKELGVNPVIASISLGAPRKFRLKHRNLKEEKLDLILENGSLLLMQGTTQHYWKHELPRTKKPVGPRINLTFRKILK
jgi:alkylated DNA repair dioxygenase AlkB